MFWLLSDQTAIYLYVVSYIFWYYRAWYKHSQVSAIFRCSLSFTNDEPHFQSKSFCQSSQEFIHFKKHLFALVYMTEIAMQILSVSIQNCSYEVILPFKSLFSWLGLETVALLGSNIVFELWFIKIFLLSKSYSAIREPLVWTEMAFINLIICFSV